MVSVPSVNIGSPVGWAAAELPSTENKGAESMIKAGLYGTAITKQKQEIAKTKKDQLDQKKLEELRGFGVDRWSNKDRKGMATVINEMAVISPDAAKNFKDALFNLDKTDAFRAGMALYTAAASSSDKAQISALKQSKDIFSMTSVPFAEGTQDMIDTPYGPERDKKMMDAVAALQAMGILPAPKDVFGATGMSAEKDLNAVQSSRHFDDGTIGFLTKGGDSYFKNRLGETVEGTERQKAVMDMMAERITTEGKKTAVKERAKESEKNYQAVIQSGKDAAGGLREAMTALDKLNTVETGGLEGLKVWVKNKLGISSDDEAVLTRVLAQNVFKQIKPVFGGNPSVQEGQWLRETEARIGQSTEGNIAVLNDMANMMMNKMDLARAEAEAATPRDEASIRYLDNAKADLLKKFGEALGDKFKPQGQQTIQPTTPGQTQQRQNVPAAGRPTNAQISAVNKMIIDQKLDKNRVSYNPNTGKFEYEVSENNWVPLDTLQSTGGPSMGNIP